MAVTHRAGKFAILLHADIAGSTSLVHQDEHLAHERIQAAFRRFGDTIIRYHGRVRELRGDALLAEFERASDAVAAALAFQASQAEYNAQIEDDIRPTVRVGIAMGEVVFADRTVTGAGVVLAQRMEQLAEPGGVCITAAIHESLPQRMPFEQQSLGEQEVKGFDEPVRVYTVRIQEGTEPPGPAAPSKERHPPWIRWAMTAAVVVLVCGGGLLAWYQYSAPEFEPVSPEAMTLPLPDKPSIAVLRFDTLSGNSEQDYLGEALSENIITELSRFKEFFVIARNSTFAYTGEPVRTVAEELGVRYVVEGSIQTADDSVRVTAQLIDATTGRHLWAERYDRELEDIFTVQDEITQTIVVTLGQSIDLVERERSTSRPVENLNAVELRLRAREEFLNFTKETTIESQRLGRKAVELDPDYAGGYIHLTFGHVFEYRYGWSDTHTREESLDLALQMGKKAVEVDPFNYEAHWALANALSAAGRHDEAMAEYDRALELNPNAAEMLAESAELLDYVGRAEEAISRVKTAMRLNPRYPDWYLWVLGLAQYFAEQYEEALTTLRKMNNMPNGARRTLAPVLVRLGRLEEARAVMAEFLENEPGYSLEDLKVWPFKHKEYLERWTEDQRKAGVPEQPPLELPDKPSIAVLPFTNMSGDSEQEYFADGITEDIITELSRFKDLFVISSTSSFAYKGRNIKVQDIARELGVRYLLEGSVRRSGEKLRITAQLIEARTGTHIWAEQYDRQLGDVFAIQDNINGKIVSTLGETLWRAAADDTTGKPTSNFEAYDYELLARKALHRFTPDDNLRARELYAKALELDPEFPDPYRGLAWTYVLDHMTQWVTTGDEALDQALDLTKKAAKLEEDNAETHRLLGRINQSKGRLDEALAQFERALELNPNNGDILANYGNALIYAGRTKEGIEWAKKAIRLNPHHPDFYASIIAFGYYLEGRYDDVLHYMNRIDVLAIYDHRLLAATYGQLDNKEEAGKHVAAALKTNPDQRISSTADRMGRAHRDPSDVERYLEGLRKAGFPE